MKLLSCMALLCLCLAAQNAAVASTQYALVELTLTSVYDSTPGQDLSGFAVGQQLQVVFMFDTDMTRADLVDENPYLRPDTATYDYGFARLVCGNIPPSHHPRYGYQYIRQHAATVTYQRKSEIIFGYGAGVYFPSPADQWQSLLDAGQFPLGTYTQNYRSADWDHARLKGTAQLLALSPDNPCGGV